MTSHALKKSLCISIALVFFQQLSLGAVAEANFWKERQKQQQKQVAALPAASPLFDLPSTQTAVRNPQERTEVHVPGASKLSKLIEGIPRTHARIQDIYDSSDSKNAPVLIVQDVHLNAEAQANIAHVIQELINQNQIGVLGVEGAFEPMDFSRFRNFEDKKITKQVADAFLENKLLAAPSYVGMTSVANLPVIVGVDDRAHYDANVQAYLSSRDEKSKIENLIIKTKEKLINEKRNVFSKALIDFDNLRTAYVEGSVNIGKYISRLTVIARANGPRQSITADPDLRLPRRSGLSPSAPRNDSFSFVIEQFMEAYELEQSLNFTRVDHERKIVIDKITRVLDQHETQTLLAQSMAYRAGKMNYGEYYNKLRIICQKKGIDLTQTPAFDNYIRYVLLSDGIDAEDLIKATKELEETVISYLAKSPDQKKLIQETRFVALVEKLINFSLTPDEWEEYTIVTDDELQVTERENNLFLLRNTSFVTRNFEEFYRQAHIRSEEMLGNLGKSKLKIEDLKSKVLVTGGFHTPDITKILKNKKISYVVVSPRITKVDLASGSAYLSIFAQEKTPLEQLFEGKKLFINPEGANVSSKRTAFHAFATMSLIASAGALTEIKGFGPSLFVSKQIESGYKFIEPLMLNDLGGVFGGSVLVQAKSIFTNIALDLQLILVGINWESILNWSMGAILIFLMVAALNFVINSILKDRSSQDKYLTDTVSFDMYPYKGGYSGAVEIYTNDEHHRFWILPEGFRYQRISGTKTTFRGFIDFNREYIFGNNNEMFSVGLVPLSANRFRLTLKNIAKTKSIRYTVPYVSVGQIFKSTFRPLKTVVDGTTDSLSEEDSKEINPYTPPSISAESNKNMDSSLQNKRMYFTKWVVLFPLIETVIFQGLAYGYSFYAPALVSIDLFTRLSLLVAAYGFLHVWAHKKFNQEYVTRWTVVAWFTFGALTIFPVPFLLYRNISLQTILFGFTIFHGWINYLHFKLREGYLRYSWFPLQSIIGFDDDGDGGNGLRIFGNYKGRPLNQISIDEVLGHKKTVSPAPEPVEDLLRKSLENFGGTGDTIRFIDLGTGDGIFIMKFIRYLNELGYQNVKGVGIEKNKELAEDLAAGLILDQNYFNVDIADLKTRYEAGTFNFVTMNAPQIISNSVSTPQSFNIIIGNIQEWLESAHHLLHPDGLALIQLYNMNSQATVIQNWLKIEGEVLQSVLDEMADQWEVIEYGFDSMSEDYPQGFEPTGPLIVLKKKKTEARGKINMPVEKPSALPGVPFFLFGTLQGNINSLADVLAGSILTLLILGLTGYLIWLIDKIFFSEKREEQARRTIRIWEYERVLLANENAAWNAGGLEIEPSLTSSQWQEEKKDRYQFQNTLSKNVQEVIYDRLIELIDERPLARVKEFVDYIYKQGVVLYAPDLMAPSALALVKPTKSQKPIWAIAVDPRLPQKVDGVFPENNKERLYKLVALEVFKQALTAVLLSSDMSQDERDQIVSDVISGRDISPEVQAILNENILDEASIRKNFNSLDKTKVDFKRLSPKDKLRSQLSPFLNDTEGQDLLDALMVQWEKDEDPSFNKSLMLSRLGNYYKEIGIDNQYLAARKTLATLAIKALKDKDWWESSYQASLFIKNISILKIQRGITKGQLELLADFISIVNLSIKHNFHEVIKIIVYDGYDLRTLDQPEGTGLKLYIEILNVNPEYIKFHRTEFGSGSRAWFGKNDIQMAQLLRSERWVVDNFRKKFPIDEYGFDGKIESNRLRMWGSLVDFYARTQWGEGLRLILETPTQNDGEFLSHVMAGYLVYGRQGAVEDIRSQAESIKIPEGIWPANLLLALWEMRKDDGQFLEWLHKLELVRGEINDGYETYSAGTSHLNSALSAASRYPFQAQNFLNLVVNFSTVLMSQNITEINQFLIDIQEVDLNGKDIDVFEKRLTKFFEYSGLYHPIIIQFAKSDIDPDKFWAAYRSIKNGDGTFLSQINDQKDFLIACACRAFDLPPGRINFNLDSLGGLYESYAPVFQSEQVAVNLKEKHQDIKKNFFMLRPLLVHELNSLIIQLKNKTLSPKGHENLLFLLFLIEEYQDIGSFQQLIQVYQFSDSRKLKLKVLDVLSTIGYGFPVQAELAQWLESENDGAVLERLINVNGTLRNPKAEAVLLNMINDENTNVKVKPLLGQSLSLISLDPHFEDKIRSWGKQFGWENTFVNELIQNQKNNMGRASLAEMETRATRDRLYSKGLERISNSKLLPLLENDDQGQLVHILTEAQEKIDSSDDSQYAFHFPEGRYLFRGVNGIGAIRDVFDRGFRAPQANIERRNADHDEKYFASDIGVYDGGQSYFDLDGGLVLIDSKEYNTAAHEGKLALGKRSYHEIIFTKDINPNKLRYIFLSPRPWDELRNQYSTSDQFSFEEDAQDGQTQVIKIEAKNEVEFQQKVKEKMKDLKISGVLYEDILESTRKHRLQEWIEVGHAGWLGLMSEGPLSVKWEEDGKKGFSEGGWAKAGKERVYVKYYESTDQLRNEWLAGSLYNEAGIKGPGQARIVMVNDPSGVVRPAIVFNEIPGFRTVDLEAIKKDGRHRYRLVLDAWLNNYDGPKLDNNGQNTKGEAVLLDYAGSLNFHSRSVRGEKPYTPEVIEKNLETLVDSSVGLNSDFYSGISEQDNQNAVARIIVRMSDERILHLVRSAGYKDKQVEQNLGHTLIEGRNRLQEKFKPSSDQIQNEYFLYLSDIMTEFMETIERKDKKLFRKFSQPSNRGENDSILEHNRNILKNIIWEQMGGVRINGYSLARLIVLAVMFHDIGKADGNTPDHDIRSIETAKEKLNLFGLTQVEQDIVLEILEKMRLYGNFLIQNQLRSEVEGIEALEDFRRTLRPAPAVQNIFGEQVLFRLSFVVYKADVMSGKSLRDNLMQPGLEGQLEFKNSWAQRLVEALLGSPSLRTINPGSIFYPWFGSDNFTKYIAPLWETGVFQTFGMWLGTYFGLPVWGTVLGIAFVFALSHFIAWSWGNNSPPTFAEARHWFILSIVFTIPFFPIFNQPVLVSYVISYFMHSFYNRDVLAGKRKGPLASVANQNENDKENKEESELNPAYAILEKEANYGFLPSDHPIMKLLDERLKMILPGLIKSDMPNVRVLASLGDGINAESYSDGTIIITPELIHILEYVEELDFVLLHELNHWLKSHHKKLYQYSNSGKISEVIGYKRYSELEADMAAFNQMRDKNRATNPRGAISALEKLRFVEKNDSGSIKWDIAHGDITDRILNMKEVSFVLTLMNFDRPLTSMAQAKAGLEDLGPGQYVYHIIRKYPRTASEFELWIREVRQITRTADWSMINVIAQHLSERVMHYQSKGKNILRGEKFDLDVMESNLKEVINRWHALFDMHYGQLSSKDQAMMRIILLEGAAGIPVYSAPQSQIVQLLNLKTLSEEMDLILRDISENDHLIELVQEANIYLDQSRIVKLFVSVLEHSLIHNASFDFEGGEGIDYKSYFRHAGQSLLNLYQLLRSNVYSKDGYYSISKAWTDVVVRAITFGVEVQSNGVEKIQEDVDNAIKELQSDYLVYDYIYLEQLTGKFQEQAQSATNRSTRKLRIMDEQFQAIENIFKRFKEHVMFEYAFKITKAAEELEKSLKYDDTPYKYNEPRNMVFLEEIEQIFRKLPEAVPGIIVSKLVGIQSYEETAFFSKFETKALFITHKLYLGPGATNGPDRESMAALIEWIARMSDNEAEYENLMEEFNFAIEEWLISDTSHFEIDYQNLNKLADKASSRWKGYRLEKNYIWQRIAVQEFYKLYQNETDANRFYDALQIFLGRWRVPLAIGKEQYSKKYDLAKQRIIKKGLELLNISGNNVSQVDAERLLMLSFFFEDPAIKRPMQDQLFLKIMGWKETENQTGDYRVNDAVDLALTRYRAQGVIVSHKILETIDERAKLKSELGYIEESISNFTNLFHNPMELMGHGVGFEGIFTYLSSKGNALRLLIALLTSGRNDSELRDIIGQVWWSIYELRLRETFITHIKNGDLDTKQSLEKWMDSRPGFISRTKLQLSGLEEEEIYSTTLDELEEETQRVSAYLSGTDLINSVYRMGIIERMFLLRLLMVGERGVLKNLDDRGKLLTAFYNQYVQSSGENEAKAKRTLLRILNAIFISAPEDELYLVVSNIFRDRIANPPVEGDWKNIAGKYAEIIIREYFFPNLFLQLLNELPFDREELEKQFENIDRKALSAQIKRIIEKLGKTDKYGNIKERSAPELDSEFVELVDLSELSKDELLFIVRYFQGNPKELPILQDQDAAFKVLQSEFEDQRWSIINKFEQFLNYDSRVDIISEEEIYKSIFPSGESKRKNDVFTPLSLIVETARQLGAPGVRFLQLLGKSIDLPEEYQKEFLSIYDDVKGQSLVAANRLIREELPEYWDQIKEYEQRLGGGSLFTVYRVRLNDGSREVREVVRVLNPQAEHHAQVFLNVLKIAIQKLIDDSESAEEKKKYTQAQSLLALLEQWIADELNDDQYENDDVHFYSRWDGHSYNGFQGKIVIPKSIKTGSKKIRREQYLEGRTFTSLTDYPKEKQREMVSLAVRHYMDQVRDEKVNLIHSDISPGNLMITKEGYLGVLDRGMFLKLDRSERLLVNKLMRSLTLRNRAIHLVNYLWSLSENAQVIKSLTKKEIINAIVAFNKANPNNTALDTLRIINSFGLSSSLTITLLFKNLNVLNKMAEEVGLGSLYGALFYQPGSKTPPGSILYPWFGSDNFTKYIAPLWETGVFQTFGMWLGTYFGLPVWGTVLGIAFVFALSHLIAWSWGNNSPPTVAETRHWFILSIVFTIPFFPIFNQPVLVSYVISYFMHSFYNRDVLAGFWSGPVASVVTPLASGNELKQKINESDIDHPMSIQSDQGDKVLQWVPTSTPRDRLSTAHTVEFLQWLISNHPEYVLKILKKIYGDITNDIDRLVELAYVKSGDNKDVYHLIFLKDSGDVVKIKFGMAYKEYHAGFALTYDETTSLERLRGSGWVPEYGGRGEFFRVIADGKVFFMDKKELLRIKNLKELNYEEIEFVVEEFIPGNEASYYIDNGLFTNQHQFDITTNLLNIGEILGGEYPLDIHPGNIIIHQKSGKPILVDIGIPSRASPGIVIRHLLNHYGSFNRKLRGISNVSIYKAIVQFYGDEKGIEYLKKAMPMFDEEIERNRKNNSVIFPSANKALKELLQADLDAKMAAKAEFLEYLEINGNISLGERGDQNSFGPGVIFRPQRFNRSISDEDLWDEVIAPTVEESVLAIFLTLSFISGSLWIYIAARFLFILSHAGIGQNGPPTGLELWTQIKSGTFFKNIFSRHFWVGRAVTPAVISVTAVFFAAIIMHFGGQPGWMSESKSIYRFVGLILTNLFFIFIHSLVNISLSDFNFGHVRLLRDKETMKPEDNPDKELIPKNPDPGWTQKQILWGLSQEFDNINEEASLQFLLQPIEIQAEILNQLDPAIGLRFNNMPHQYEMAGLYQEELRVEVLANQYVWVQAGDYWYRIWIDNNDQHFPIHYQAFLYPFSPQSLRDEDSHYISYNDRMYFGRGPRANYGVRNDSLLSNSHFGFYVRRGTDNMYSIFFVGQKPRNGTTILAPDINGQSPFVQETPERLSEKVVRMLEKSKEPIIILVFWNISQLIQRNEIINDDEFKSETDKIIEKYGNSLPSDDKKMLSEIGAMIWHARKKNVEITIGRRIDQRTFDQLELLLEALDGIPIEILKKSPRPLVMKLGRIEDLRVGGRAHIGGDISFGGTQMATMNNYKSLVSHELLHILSWTINADESDFIFPVADWLDFMETQGYADIKIEGRPVRELFDVKKDGGIRQVQENIKTLIRGNNMPGDQQAYFKDPHEILVWNALREGGNNNRNYYFGKMGSAVQIRSILERSILRDGNKVFRYDSVQQKWNIVPIQTPDKLDLDEIPIQGKIQNESIVELPYTTKNMTELKNYFKALPMVAIYDAIQLKKDGQVLVGSGHLDKALKAWEMGLLQVVRVNNWIQFIRVPQVTPKKWNKGLVFGETKIPALDNVVIPIIEELFFIGIPLWAGMGWEGMVFAQVMFVLAHLGNEGTWVQKLTIPIYISVIGFMASAMPEILIIRIVMHIVANGFVQPMFSKDVGIRKALIGKSKKSDADLIKELNQGPLKLDIGNLKPLSTVVTDMGDNQNYVVWADNEDQMRNLIRDVLRGKPGNKLRVGTYNQELEQQYANHPQIVIILRNKTEKTTVLDIVEANSKVNLLMLQGVALPESYLDIDPKVFKLLALYIVTTTLNAIQIPVSMMINWKAFRQALISA